MFALLELFFGAAIVVGHNVLHVVPNEVPILAVAGLLSFRVRSGSFAAIGLGRPPSWRRVLLLAVAAAALRILLADLVIDPLTSLVWPPAKAPGGTDQIRGNLGAAALALCLVWTFAAFGEELAYRGYLLARAEEAIGESRFAPWIALLVSSALFGLGHWYKGPAGVIDSGIAGVILGAAYLLSGRKLWASIFAHGLIDTVGVTFVFFGWDS